MHTIQVAAEMDDTIVELINNCRKDEAIALIDDQINLYQKVISSIKLLFFIFFSLFWICKTFLFRSAKYVLLVSMTFLSSYAKVNVF